MVVASPNSDGPFMCETCGHDATNEVLASHMTVGQALRRKEDLAFGIVYYIQFGPRIKIGTTRNLDQRLDALPHDAMLAFELGGYRREQARHKQFAHLLVDGQREWFNEAPDLMVHIKQLAQGHRFIEVDAKAALRQAGRRYERAV